MNNNFTQIRELLRFPDSNSFYFLEIIKRRKDAGNEEMDRHQRLIKDFYIYSLDEFDKLKDKVIGLCNENNARAYFRLNRRDAKKIAFQYNKRLAELLITEDYKSVPKIYASVVGEFHSDENKSWLLDIDYIDNVNVEEVKEFVNTLQPEGEKIIAEIPTKNGIHLITKPFRKDVFKQKYPNLDTHSDNPTILYMP